MHVAEVTTGFRQTVDRSRRTQVAHGGFRAELRQYRLQRVTVSTWQTAAARGKATGGFFEASCGINRAVRRGFRAQLLGQRVGAQQQVLHVAEVTTGFRQTVDRSGRTQVAHGSFRAELRQNWLQRVTVSTWQTTATRGKATGCFRETGCGIDRAVRRGFRAQLLGQRVGAQQQVLHVLEVTASFRQAVDRCGWAEVRHGGFRAELLKGRGERIATAVASTAAAITTTWNATAHQGFSKTLGRINSAIRIIFRTNLLGQRITGGEHIVNVYVGTAGFVKAVDRRFRAHLLFAGFRAKLSKQLVRTGETAITTRQVATAANGFRKAGCRINRAIRRRFRTQLFGQRVGATDHVADVLEVTGCFLQTGRREGGGAIKGSIGIVDEILIQHFTIESERGIEYLCRFRAELLYYRIQ